LDNLKRLTPYKFTKIRSLAYTLDDKCNGDEFIILMAKLFSGLNNISPYGAFHFAHLTSWPYLRKLDLTSCCSPTFRFECKEISKLKMLEELILPNESIKQSDLENIMHLPKLQTLIFNMDSEQFDDFLCEMRSRIVENITFQDSIWEFHTSNLKLDLISLRQLTIVDDKNYAVEELHSLIKALPQLERLDLIQSPIFTSEIELWKAVVCCPTLNVINISSVQLYADFFDNSRSPMERVLNKRTTPLTLHCHDTGENDYLVSRDCLSPFFYNTQLSIFADSFISEASNVKGFV